MTGMKNINLKNVHTAVYTYLRTCLLSSDCHHLFIDLLELLLPVEMHPVLVISVLPIVEM